MRLAWRAAGAIAALCTTLTLTASAQTVRGVLVDEASGAPINAAFVALVGPDGVHRGRALTDSRGRFTVRAPTAGVYTLKSQIIGIQSVTSEPFALVNGQVLEYRFVIPAAPVVLSTLIIEDRRICSGRPGSGMAAGRLWNEAQKALEAVVWTEDQRLLKHRLVRYEREVDPRNTAEILDQESWSLTGTYEGSPFGSPDAEELAERGYVQGDDGDWIYYGPDANALLSNAFASSHCFTLRRTTQGQERLVGLSFEPLSDTEVPDVSGTLWVDEQTAELRYVEFRYTNGPWPVETNAPGGRIEFERLATGQWIVKRWSLRMPVIGVRQSMNRLGAIRGSDEILDAIKETGGWVSEVRTLDGRLVGRTGGSSIQGTVVDNADRVPLERAKVMLLGTIYETRTDGEGHFRFSDLPEGTYAITYSHEVLEGLGFVPPPGEIELARDQALTIELSVPTRAAMWPHACPQADPETFAIASGFVTDASTKEPISEVSVFITARKLLHLPDGRVQEMEVSGQGKTDWAGYYLVCEVPTSVEATVRVRRTGWEADSSSINLVPGEFVRRDFALEVEKPRTVAVQTSNRFSIGANVGAFALSDNSGTLAGAPKLEGYVQYSPVDVIQINGGAHYSSHSIGQTAERYNLFQLFMEPRVVWRGLSQKVWPFLGGRVGLAWERVNETGADFRSTGVALGGLGGLQLRLDEWVSLETGASIGALSFNDFDFKGEPLWAGCIRDQLPVQPHLPDIVSACAPTGPRGGARPVLTPGEAISGTGELDKVTGVNSRRKDQWLSFWLGVRIGIKRR